MNKRLLHLLPFFALALLCAGALSARKSAHDEAALRKAEYIFLEAANARADERYDDMYMLLRHAKRLSPDDPYIDAALGEIELVLPGADSVTLERAYDAVARRFRIEPTNQRYAAAFNNVAQQARRIDDIIEIWQTQDSLRPDRSDPAFNLASSLTARFSITGDTADLQRALDIYSRLEKGLGHTLPVSGRKINIYLAINDTAPALAEIRQLERDAPRDIDTKLFAGTLYDHLGMPDSALARFDRAAAIEPDNGSVYLTRASFFREQGDSARYDTEVFRALESPTLDFAPKFQLLTDYVAKLYQDSLQWPRIDRMFVVMQEQNPGEAMLHELLASYKSVTGKPAEAAEQLSYSIDLDPSEGRRWSDLVQLYFTLEDTAHVRNTAEKAMALFPENGYFPLAISSVLAMEGRDEDALAMIDTLDLRSYGNDLVSSAIWSTKGDILWRLGKPQDASAAYREAILLNPENYMAMNNFAYFNACEGTELGAAQLYASIATTAEPDNITYLDTYAWVFFKKKDYIKAKEIIDKVFKNDDDGNLEAIEPSAEIYDHAGDIYFMNGEPKEAVKFWEKALELDPDNKLIQKKVRHKTYFYE